MVDDLNDPISVIRHIRADDPTRISRRFADRRRRALLAPDGNLLIIAADHPARASLAVRDQPMAMASRSNLLHRLALALARPGVDGVLATPDIVDDLLLMGALEDRVVIGSMNRGGLHGACFELDDRFAAYDADALATSHLDGGKMLCRIDLNDPGTASTLEACGQAITALAGRELMALIEPFWTVRADGRIRNDLSPDAVIRSIHVAQGLGTTSSRTWLKLPVIDEMDRVMDATTLPTLLLGGDPSGEPEDTYATWRKALQVPGVRGLVVGRALLYPPDADVATAVDHAASLVHD